jgi:hypothetical protein
MVVTASDCGAKGAVCRTERVGDSCALCASIGFHGVLGQLASNTFKSDIYMGKSRDRSLIPAL